MSKDKNRDPQVSMRMIGSDKEKLDELCIIRGKKRAGVLRELIHEEYNRTQEEN